MKRFTTSLALALALVAPPLARGQGPPLPGASRAEPGAASRALSPAAMRDARSPTRELRRFEAGRRAEAGVRLLDVSRDASRRAAEAELLRAGTPADVARHAEAATREEEVDRLRLAAATGPERRAWLESLGPVTRRVMAASAVELRTVRRREELRVRRGELERAVEQRPPAPGLR